MTKFIKNKFIRKMILIALDFLMLLISYLLIFIIFDYKNLNFNNINLELFKVYIYILISLLIYIISGQYNSLSEYFNRLDSP